MKLNEPISFGSKGAKQGPYPTKTTVNLVSAEAARGNATTQIALFVIALVLIGVFAKFAVVDPIAAGMDSSAEVTAAQERLRELQVENANFAELNEQYARYVVVGLTEEEQNLADRDAVLNLLETKVMGVGYLQSLKVTGNVATVNLIGANLDDVSKLVESLEADGRVAHVTVSTAQGETDARTSATIQIALKGALETGDEDASAEAGSNAVGGASAEEGSGDERGAE